MTGTVEPATRAAMARPWWLNNFADKHGHDYCECFGCRRQWYRDFGDKIEHGSRCQFAKLDAALDALEAAAEGVTS